MCNKQKTGRGNESLARYDNNYIFFKIARTTLLPYLSQDQRLHDGKPD